MNRFLIPAVLLVLVPLLLLFACKHFTADSVMDKGRMENPFSEDSGSLNSPEDAANVLRAGRPGKEDLPDLHK